MRTIENLTDPVGEFVCPEKSLRLDDLGFRVGTHFGSMEFNHGLCLGKRQLTILTPASLPLSLTRRLCDPSQRLTSLETCQLALSQIRRRRRTFLPISSSFSVHHERNRV
jgi:hypothetical protein